MTVYCNRHDWYFGHCPSPQEVQLSLSSDGNRRGRDYSGGTIRKSCRKYQSYLLQFKHHSLVASS
jgi:hypothetical protein